MAPKKKTPIVSEFILLDRSASMSSRWDEMVGALNGYVEKTQKEGQKSEFTLACFDDVGYDVLRDAVREDAWKPVTKEDASPRGNTPLYDSMAKIIAAAETRNNEKTVLIIVTDGEENSSRETNKEAIQKRIDAFKSKNWQVVFLGADFNAYGQASSVGVSTSNTLNMTRGFYGSGMDSLLATKCAYASTGATMDFNDEDRQLAAGKKTK